MEKGGERLEGVGGVLDCITWLLSGYIVIRSWC